MANKNRNKVLIKDPLTGMRWWVTTKGVVCPTNWRLQCALYDQQVYKKKVEEKLNDGTKSH